MKYLETYSEFNSINESKDLSRKKKRLMKLLTSRLENCVDIAEQLGDLANKQFDDVIFTFDGTEGQDISILLRDIYNAFMTGDREDTEFEDQEFK